MRIYVKVSLRLQALSDPSLVKSKYVKEVFSCDGTPNAFVNSGLVLEDFFNSLVIFIDTL